MWQFHHLRKDPSEAALVKSLFDIEVFHLEKEEMRSMFCQLFNYMFFCARHRQFTVKAEANIMNFKQPKSVISVSHWQVLYNKASFCDPMQKESCFKQGFIMNWATQVDFHEKFTEKQWRSKRFKV